MVGTYGALDNNQPKKLPTGRFVECDLLDLKGLPSAPSFVWGARSGFDVRIEH